MGIYDRDYYRKEGPSFLDSIVHRGRVCRWLVAINILVFLVQLWTRPTVDTPRGPVLTGASGAFTDALLLNTAAVMQGEIWRLLTYAFLHDPFMWQHIVFNLLFLWWFGSDIEDLYGPREFLAFYLASAVCGGLIFQAVAVVKGGPMSCLGASGAVTAVMVLCACHFPNRIILFMFFLPLPIWVFVGFQVVQDAFYFIGDLKTQTAVSVHLGGAAFAFMYYQAQWRLLGFWPNWSAWQRKRSRPKLRVYHGDDVEHEPATITLPSRASDIDEQLEAKLDAVLEKVARAGKESLTESERAILLRASEIYKRRRT